MGGICISKKIDGRRNFIVFLIVFGLFFVHLQPVVWADGIPADPNSSNAGPGGPAGSSDPGQAGSGACLPRKPLRKDHFLPVLLPGRGMRLLIIQHLRGNSARRANIKNCPHGNI